MPPYKIAVVGPVPIDTIYTFKGEVITKYGCVTHPAIALAKLLKGRGKVIPVTHIHKADHKAVNALLSPYENINLSGIYSHNDRGTIIELKFLDQNNRLEKQLSKMSPVKPEDVAPFLDADCFVFVPITDFEIELNTLKFIKENSDALVIFDAHGPTTFVTEEGNRLRRYWREQEAWLPYIDVLKMNLEESLCCWFEKDYTFEEGFDEDNTDHLDAFAGHVLSRGVNTLYITLDARGCVIYTGENEVVKKDFVASVPVKEVIDTTGCGDSFAGGLAYGFTVHKDAVKAARYANVLGALRTQGKDFGVFKSLEETDAMIDKYY